MTRRDGSREPIRTSYSGTGSSMAAAPQAASSSIAERSKALATVPGWPTEPLGWSMRPRARSSASWSPSANRHKSLTAGAVGCSEVAPSASARASSRSARAARRKRGRIFNNSCARRERDHQKQLARRCPRFPGNDVRAPMLAPSDRRRFVRSGAGVWSGTPIGTVLTWRPPSPMRVSQWPAIEQPGVSRRGGPPGSRQRTTPCAAFSAAVALTGATLGGPPGCHSWPGGFDRGCRRRPRNGCNAVLPSRSNHIGSPRRATRSVRQAA
jgi:hypothetical protein